MRRFWPSCWAITLLTMTIAIDALAKPSAISAPSKKVLEQYIQQVASTHHISSFYLRSVLKRAQKNEAVLKSISHPFEKTYWPRYQKHFLGARRVREGVTYWKSHEKTLNVVAKQYQVDPSVIVAIIGVETHYGKNQGHFRALDALWTLSFYYPKRATFFKKQLTAFLVLTKKQNLLPLKLKSSYAGALGIPQFMPSIYRRLGVDYNHKHHADLFSTHEDAIASIANYLQHSQWKRHAPVASPVTSRYPLHAGLTKRHKKGTMTVSDFRKEGIKPQQHMALKQKADLIALELSPTDDQYWLAFPNFRAILTYNNSINYAMAVYQLSEAIKKAHDSQHAHHS